ncbi:MAG: SRPBCC family protein [Candidatus Binatia bacterium]
MRVHAYRLERTQVVLRPLDEVFAFFADAGNLELLTPKFLHFCILTPSPIRVAAGTLIEYRLQLFRLSFHWHTRIETFEPGRRFTDVQLTGPYRRWHHLHEFMEVPGGTLVRDIVDYELPLGWFGRAAHALFVRRMLARIFAYRRTRIEKIFGPSVEE